MVQRFLTEFAIGRPKIVMLISFIITLIFLAAFPRLVTDTDPVHMLPKDNPAVLLYMGVKKEFAINDMVALGIKSKNGQSLFTKDGLAKIHAITQEILNSKIDDEIIEKRDIIAVSTIDDIVKNQKGELLVTPLMKTVPASDDEASGILRKLNSNPVLSGKMAAKDGSLVGIFMPIKEGKKEMAHAFGERVKKIAEKYLGEGETYYFAGLPIAESTFGQEMFLQMALYAPLAGLVIFLLMLYFFRSFKLVVAPMILGGMVVIWSMGALIYSGNVIHIMSSMIPIFLLPIGVLNSIHILSKLGNSLSKFSDKKDAIRDIMKELFAPMLYTSLTTVVGFASLSTTGIPPVIVFGVTVGFGVIMSWLLSMTFIPAYTMLLSESVLKKIVLQERRKDAVVDIVLKIKRIALSFPRRVIVSALLLLIVSIIGLRMIIVNDNPVRWFKEGHFLRIADINMNKALAGTYMANLYFKLPAQKVVEKSEGNDFDAFNEDEIEYPSIKNPEAIAYMNKVGEFLKTIKDVDGNILVGDVTSIVDLLKKVGDAAFDTQKLPETREKISQYMFLFESGDVKKGKDMWKLINKTDASAAQMWVYFKSGDNQNMTRAMHALAEFMEQNPAPTFKTADGKDIQLEVKWSGLVHINNVWQKEMVSGMMWSLASSFVMVFFMMLILFRSVSWAFIAMLPLTLTIMAIYGAIGYAGKFYDMPIAVLSSLTLGLSIDFAIHFIEHIRLYAKRIGKFDEVMDEMFSGTAQAIWRNVLVISIGFMPLFFAGLVPYITVGSFFFAIMLVSGVSTLLLMPAIVKQFKNILPDIKNLI